MQLFSQRVAHKEQVASIVSYQTAPGFSVESYLRKAKALVCSDGQDVEQTFLYLHENSIRAWERISTHPAYVLAENSFPVREITAKLLHSMRHRSVKEIEMLILGPGTGRLENRLIQCLIRDSSIEKMDLRLIDVGARFLKKSADQILNSVDQYVRTPVSIQLLHGDFLNLPTYKKAAPIGFCGPNSMKLITLLGSTFCNLRQEVDFLRNGIMSMIAGESNVFFLVDVALGYAPSSHIGEIQKLDPWVNRKTDWWEMETSFLSAPFFAYRQDIQFGTGVEFSCSVDMDSVSVPGSYEVRMNAHIAGEKQFVMQRFKRYDDSKLGDFFRGEGLEPVGSFFYNKNRAVYLLTTV